MPNYRVQLADRESGAEHSVIIEAERESDVREHPAIQGFLIGDISTFHPTNIPRETHLAGNPEIEQLLRALTSDVQQIRHTLKKSRLITQPVRTIARGIILVWLVFVAVGFLIWLCMLIGAGLLLFA